MSWWHMKVTVFTFAIFILNKKRGKQNEKT